MSRRWLRYDAGATTSSNIRRILNIDEWFGNNDINQFINVLYECTANDKNRFRGDIAVQSANIFVSKFLNL